MVRKRAFTLVELLVVIAIIALLLSIVVPSLRKARAIAQNVICQSNLRQTSLLIFLYANDNDGSFNRGIFDTASSTDKSVYWLIAYSPYMDEAYDGLLCPATVELKPGQSYAGNHKAAWPSTWAEGLRDVSGGSYGKNSWCSNPDTFQNPTRTVPSGHTYEQAAFPRITELPAPGEVPLFGDCYWWMAYPLETDGPWRDGDYFGRSAYPNDGNTQRPDMARFTLDRHPRGQINMSFGDNSVRPVHIKELWSLRWHRHFDRNNEWNRLDRTDPAWPQWMRGL